MVEGLQIRNMVRNHNLALKTLDASWSKFFRLLHDKAERAARVVLKVNPRGTSQENKDEIEDRDYRAAMNILCRGISGLGQPSEPVKRRPLLRITSNEVITGQVFSVKQEAPCESWG